MTPLEERREALALIEVCVARGVPILAFSAAGSSHPERRELSGRVLRGPGESGYLYEISKMTRGLRRNGCRALEIEDGR